MVKVYKNRLLNAMESFTYYNIAIFAIISWYTFDDSGAASKAKDVLQTVAAYTSVGLQFCLFVVVIVYHVYRYGSAKMYNLCFRMGKRIIKRSDESWNPSDSKIFDAIDNQQRYIPPLFSAYRPIRSESLSAMAVETQQPLEAESENDVDISRSLEKSRTVTNSSASTTEFHSITHYRKKESSNNNTIMNSSDSTVKPLLEEDKL